MEDASSELKLGLQSLQLANERELQSCHGRVRRLTSGLPAFDSVWIDALVEQKLLSPFQAFYFEEKNWTELEVNSDIILCSQLQFDRVMPLFLGTNKNSKSQFFVTRIDLKSIDLRNLNRLSDLISRNEIGESSSALACDYHVNKSRSILDIICPAVQGESLNELLIRRGRFPEDVVRAIALDVCQQLEERGTSQLHGDLRLSNILLTDQGKVELLNMGVLSALMPTMNIHQSLPADAYDNLAPERIESNQKVCVATEMYSLGCLLWHLLAGRAPHLLADPLEKMAAHRQQNIKDVREYVPNCSESFSQLISSMTSRRPLNRPHNFLQVIETLNSDKNDSNSRVKQFLAAFESSAPRQTKRATRSRTNRVLKPALLTLMTIISVSLFWGREKFGIAELSHLSASTISEKIELEESTEVEQVLPFPVSTNSSREEEPENASDSEKHAFQLLPQPDSEGYINLLSNGPFLVHQLQHNKQIVIRSRSSETPKLIISAEKTQLTAPKIEIRAVDIEFQDSEKYNGANSITVNSEEVHLDGCSISERKEKNHSSSRTSLIDWFHLDNSSHSAGRLLVANCVNLSDRDLITTNSPISTVLFENVFLRSDARFLTIKAGVQAGMLVPVVFNHCTQSTASPAIGIYHNSQLTSGGKLSVQGENSILAATSKVPAIEFIDIPDADEWQSHMEISARGLILRSDAMLFGTQNSDSTYKMLDSSNVRIDGLLSGNFEFTPPPPSNQGIERYLPGLVIKDLPIRISTELPGFRFDAFRDVRQIY